jgi:hypothetical protein
MVIYEVTAIVDTTFSGAFERYMISQHVPDVMATGCFLSAVVARAGDTFQFRYAVTDRATLEAYFSEHAETLRADVIEHFPEGIKLSRQILDVIAEFPSG